MQNKIESHGALAAHLANFHSLYDALNKCYKLPELRSDRIVIIQNAMNRSLESIALASGQQTI